MTAAAVTSTARASRRWRWTRHKLCIRAEEDRIQGWLDDQALLDRRDNQFKSWRIALRTEAGSIIVFDDPIVAPLSGGRT
jgi:hypothetical protein